ncbi:MAG: ATP-binding protein [bacterium]|nr:ATP-binding protein [bacterium]
MPIKSDDSSMVQRFLEETKDIVLACNPERKITFANEAASIALGYPIKKIIGRDLLDGVEEYSRFLSEGLFDQTLKNTYWHGELLLRRADDTVFPAYVSASPITGESGNVERVLVIAQDVTQRKKFEEQIRKNAELANSIIRIAPIGIFTLDMDRNFMACNRAFTKIIGGRSPQSYIHKPFDEVARKLNPELIDAIEAGFEGAETSVINRPLMGTGPGDLTVSLITVPLRDVSDKVEAVLVLIENRTELVKVEEQLLQADKLASTGFLAAGIAHEINNPLAGIYTVIDTLAKRVRREGGNEEPYQRILTNLDRVKDIIKRLLDYANPVSIHPRKADINALIIQVMDFFKYHPIFRKIKVEWELADNLPEIVVDPKQLQQIFHNIIMNAAQAMKDKGGRLVISTYLAESEIEGKKIVIIKVRDTGPGIPEENLRRIFDPFFTTKPPGEGTGLGLSVCYSIAKNHGGDLTVGNHPDGGAEVVLTIPVKKEY